VELYCPEGPFDELIVDSGRARRGASRICSWLRQKEPGEIISFKESSESVVREMGISFASYSSGVGNTVRDRPWPYDLIPRIVERGEWEKIGIGLIQRVTALNRFIDDIYGEQRILEDGIIPSDLVLESPNYRAECRGVRPPHGAWAQICGIDLIRDAHGTFRVLEDNLRVPSGVSYMIENREITKRVVPELFEHYSVFPVDDYPSQLFKVLSSLTNRRVKRPCIVVLTPGIYNSAYFEHAYLARAMGVELVEGRDLVVGDNEFLYMKTVEGLVKVDVVYRRIDEDFLDPEVFNPNSALGVPGLMRAWRSGKVAIANAPGSGVADDKAIYAFVPEMIRYYLNEAPIVPNVETFLCRTEKDREFVLNNLENLVVKPINESGGKGIMVGPHSSQKRINSYKKLISDSPETYVAQPTVLLSTAPTITEGGIQPRHLDLRPFVLQGQESWVTPGGLTRVALQEGSLVVNSSQGGGSKDTWIVGS